MDLVVRGVKMLKVYGDLMSQPTRAVLAFCKLTQIPHELVLVDLRKRLHQSPSYLAVNPAGEVPAIEDGDFKLAEVHAILPYLACTRKVPEHWYPAGFKARAAVDQVLHWHHSHLRYASKLSHCLYIAPKQGLPVEEWRVEEARTVLVSSLNLMEHWLTQRKFLTSDAVSIADLSAVCEISQLQLIDFPLDTWPRLKTWYEQIYTWPEVVEVHRVLSKVLARKAKLP
jgi:glutathione S-transferase